jgi:uncharacterized membrane protein
MKNSTYLIKLTLQLSLGFSIFAIVLFGVFGAADSEHWAHFGDYVGGLLSPVIAFANLIVLLVISYQLAERDDKRNKLPLQHAAFQELVEILDEVNTITFNTIVFGTPALIHSWHATLIRFRITKAQLFLHSENLPFDQLLSAWHELHQSSIVRLNMVRAVESGMESQDNAGQAEVNFLSEYGKFYNARIRLIESAKVSFAQTN